MAAHFLVFVTKRLFNVIIGILFCKIEAFVSGW